MTTLQLHDLMLFMFGYQFISALVNRRRTARRSERAVQTVAAAAVGIPVAGTAVIVVLDFAHPESVTRVDAWQIWLFVAVDALILLMLGARLIRYVVRAARRA